MKSKSVIQHLDKPIKSSLTLREILSIAGVYTSADTSTCSHIDDLEAFSLALDMQVAINNRTGLECRMVYAEYKRERNEIDDDFDFVRHYAVELNTGNVYVSSIFETIDENKNYLNYLKNEAAKTFITWSSLIGVKVDHKLCALVSGE